MTVLALVLFVVFMAEAVLLWSFQLRDVRAEAAYWEAKRNRPELYDWAKELDL